MKYLNKAKNFIQQQARKHPELTQAIEDKAASIGRQEQTRV